MGLISSICKQKRQVYHDPIVQNNYTQTTISTGSQSPSISSEKTQCSAISRQPTKHSTFQDPYCFSPTYPKAIRDLPDFPIFTSPFCLPYNNLYHSSSPYLAQSYNSQKKDATRTTKVTTIETHNQDHLIKRSASTPIDTFLIDISKEQVLLGQPISMNIRHLLLNSSENHPTTHENLLDYIPYVCEQYPNVTVDPNQITRNTLYVRMPT